MSHIQPNTHLPKPIDIKIYTAILNQSGTGIPVATILHNTIGEIIWTYESTGVYKATLPYSGTGLFIASFITRPQTDKLLMSAQTGTNGVRIRQTNLTGVATDQITNAAFEIKTYNNI